MTAGLRVPRTIAAEPSAHERRKDDPLVDRDQLPERMLFRRVVGAMIDWMLGAALVALVAWAGAKAGAWSDMVDGTRGTVIDQSLLLACLVAFGAVFAARLRRFGQTLGKQAVGLRVTGTDYLGILVLRDLIKYLPVSLGLIQPALLFLLLVYPASFAVAAVKPGTSLHDLLMRTRVEHEES